MILAIDPGKTGSLAWGSLSLEGLCKTPDDIHALSELIRQINPSIAVLELVHAMPGQGVTSMFNFGKTFGQMEGVLSALNIDVHYVTPQKWIKHYREKHQIGESSAFSSKRDWKKSLYSKAQELYPRDDMKLCHADSVLIWHYWREKDDN